MDFSQILILASESPRRRELLKLLLDDFAVCKPVFDEDKAWRDLADLPLDIALGKIASGKGRSLAENLQNAKILSADTVAVLQDKVIGKPKDEEDAVQILSAMSGTTHEVKTAYSVLDLETGGEESKVVSTKVYMRELTRGEILAYVASGEALGKAGAYAIQETGDRFVKYIEGSFSNVVGLPLEDLWDTLNRMGLRLKPAGAFPQFKSTLES